MKYPFASALRRLREQRRISQERLAEKAGVGRTYVGRIERSVLNPTMTSVGRLLKELRVTWAQFGAAIDATESGTRISDPPSETDREPKRLIAKSGPSDSRQGV